MSSNRFDLIWQALRSTAIRQAFFLLGIFGLSTTLVWLATYGMVVRDTKQLVELRLETLVDNAELAIVSESELPETQPGQFLALLKGSVRQQGTLPAELSVGNRKRGFHHTESSEGSGQTDYVLLIREVSGTRIIAAENIERLEETTDIFLAGLQFALLSSLLATLMAGLWVARRHQARLDRISHGLERVSLGELDSRIELEGSADDDLSLLASRINATTARLETTMTQMRVQTANIAHDLRTPLARLRALLEDSHIALQDKGETVSEEVLEDALIQIDQIVDTFNAILRITRIESGMQKSSFVSVDLAVLAQNVKETFGPVVEDQGQSLLVEVLTPASITGDPDLIVQLLGNLIQNALRHGARNQQISLVLNGVQMLVTDQGPGIPKKDWARVLQPLYQREKQCQGEGFGLGLALVKAICELHDAHLILREGANGIGLQVVVTFP